MLSIRIIEEQIPIIVIAGEIKEYNKEDIEAAIRMVLTPAKNQLILDLTCVRTLDSGEIQAIIEASHRSLGGGGRLALVVKEKDKENALERSRILGVPGVFIFSDRKEAKDYLGERGYGITA